METSKISPNVSNLSMPRGALSFAAVNDNGVMTGEIDLGNVTGFDLTNAIAYKEHLTSHDSVVILDAKKASEQKWTVKFTPEERSAENMALFFLGDPDGKDKLTQTQGTATGQNAKTYLNRWIDLGKKYIKPVSITVTQTSPSKSFTCALTVSGEDTNCRVDYENGMIMIKTASGFVDGGTITVDFKYGAASLNRFPTRIRPMVGFLRYRGLSENGPRHSIECWKVQITPDAAINMVKPQDYAGLGFSGDVYIDDDTNTHRATDPFFKVTELDVATSYPS